MNAAFRLLNSKGRGFLNKLIKSEGVNINYIVDANESRWGEKDSESGIEFISPYRFFDLYNKGEIEKLIVSPYVGCDVALDVVNEMMAMGMPKNAFVVPSIPDVEEREIFTDEFLTMQTVDELKSLFRVQYHIADHCNLNCDACSHYSSLVQGEVFISIEEIKNDLLELKRLVKHVDVIDILGGEPFLNKNWKEYIKITKEIYPYSELTIITNGTLIKKMTEADWTFLRENDVCFRMSLYKPFWDQADGIAAELKRKGVKYILNLRVISEFAHVLLKEKRYSRDIARKNCSGECNQIFHGKMAPCNQIMYINYFNKYWGTKYPEDAPVENLNDVNNYNELVSLLNKSMDLCEYCNMELRSQNFHEWGMMKPGGKNNNDINKWIY